MNPSKRQFLKQSLSGLGVYSVGVLWSNILLAGYSKREDFELQPADANGVRLLKGFRSRVIARSDQPVLLGEAYAWHAAPDGGACFARDDDGWIYRAKPYRAALSKPEQFLLDFIAYP